MDIESLRAQFVADQAAFRTTMEHILATVKLPRIQAWVGIGPTGWAADTTPINPQTTQTRLILPTMTSAHKNLAQVRMRKPLEAALLAAGTGFITALHAALPALQGPCGLVSWGWIIKTAPTPVNIYTLSVNGLLCDPHAFTDDDNDAPFSGFVTALAQLHALKPATARYKVNTTSLFAHSPEDALTLYRTIGPDRHHPHRPREALLA